MKLELRIELNGEITARFIDRGLFTIGLVKDVVEARIEAILLLVAKRHAARQVESRGAAEAIARIRSSSSRRILILRF